MTQAPTSFYLRRVGAMVLMGSIVTNLAILAAMIFVITIFAPVASAETIAMPISN